MNASIIAIAFVALLIAYQGFLVWAALNNKLDGWTKPETLTDLTGYTFDVSLWETVLDTFIPQVSDVRLIVVSEAVVEEEVPMFI